MLTVSLIAVSLLMTPQEPPAAGDRIAGRPFATRSPVLGTRGMVCTSHPLAAQIGLDVLQDGGSAVDAAIATNAALGLMEPTSNGIGGDVFVIYWDNAKQELVGLNGSGRSPRSADLEALKKTHKLFARKFDMQRDASILDAIDEQILNVNQQGG